MRVVNNLETSYFLRKTNTLQINLITYLVGLPNYLVLSLLIWSTNIFLKKVNIQYCGISYWITSEVKFCKDFALLNKSPFENVN